jgi:hypothetical protein
VEHNQSSHRAQLSYTDRCKPKCTLRVSLRPTKAIKTTRKRKKWNTEKEGLSNSSKRSLSRWAHWYVSNVSIIFDAPCLFLHHLPIVSLHLVAFLYIFRN